MILIKRHPMPQAFKKQFEKELRDILKHYEADKQPQTFKFRAYKTKGVADALNTMFHGKCAYCETRMLAVQPADIEHFRPKAKVDGEPNSRGYYWLAATWENLLASCILCNRPNRHQRPNDPEKKTLGKANQFPLKENSKRALRSDHDHMEETPLILDPCGKGDPRDHLMFEDDGEVKPRKRGGRVSEFGEATIEVLALQRSELVKDRREHAIRLLGDIYLIDDLSEIAETDPEAHYLQGQRLKLLADYLQPSRPYIALVKDIIDRHQPGLLDNFPEILRRIRSLKKPKPFLQNRSLTRSIGDFARQPPEVRVR